MLFSLLLSARAVAVRWLLPQYGIYNAVQHDIYPPSLYSDCAIDWH
ncbi:hypothetical protein [Yersinia alsatica]|nr:hypothetical protein [Yersinia alsatica]